MDHTITHLMLLGMVLTLGYIYFAQKRAKPPEE